MSLHSLREAAEVSKAWPFEEARKLIARLGRSRSPKCCSRPATDPRACRISAPSAKSPAPTMVRHAFRVLTGDPSRPGSIAFSDDMDGLRKVPDNVPNNEMLAAHLGKPLTEVPDPFGEFESFAAHNNARLRGFLDRFGFDYEFASSTDSYTSGRFDAALLRMLARFDAVQAIMLPIAARGTRGDLFAVPADPPADRRRHAGPGLGHDAKAGTIRWRDPETGEEFETPVTGGHCKLQWKPDWAMRWYALGVDYEMAGKDLIDSGQALVAHRARARRQPPEGFNYELFLDENGQKISKSKGNGLTIDEWLTYASPESLSLFMYQKPTAAKRLYFDVIPRTVDDYLGFLDAYPRQEWKERLGNPVWHIHAGEPPAPEIARPRREAADDRLLRHAAQSRRRRQQRKSGGAVGLPAPLCAGGLAGEPSRGSTACSLRGRLFSRFRRAEEALPARPTRSSARRSGSCRRSSRNCRRTPSAEAIQHALYDIARPIPRYQDLKRQGRDAGAAGRLERLLQHALRGAARRGAGAALSARSSRSTASRRRGR